METDHIKRLQMRLAVARGEHPVDVLFTNGKVINVFSGRIEEYSIAVFDGIIIGFGEYPASKTVDLHGAFIAPGFIEAHIHIESSKLTPGRFAEVVLAHGTTTVIADPHEIANVLGIAGIRFMLESARNSVLDVYYMLPSCVPATSMETAGADLSAADLRPLLDEPDILGIGEMMNFPGTFLSNPSVLSKAALGGTEHPIDGHAPGLTDRNLSAYIIAGPTTDHECTSLEEAEEKLAKGMRILIREGSAARNLETLLPLVNPTTERRIMFVTDDRRSGDLLELGHLDYTLKRAVELGLDPILAIRMVTLNPAEAYGLMTQGAIRPGAVADLVLLKDLIGFKVSAVWKGGVEVVRNGKYTGKPAVSVQTGFEGSLSVPKISTNNLSVPDRGSAIRVIGLIPDQIVTEGLTAKLPVVNDKLSSDSDKDIVKLVVIERYSGHGGRGIGFIRGMGIRCGAIASTVAHDSHNIIAAGDNDRSIITAVERLTELGGGQVVTAGENVLAELSLPIAGLMSDQPTKEVAIAEEKLIVKARELGCKPSDPFMALSFLALPVIPALKLTDKGLVDVNKFQFVSLYI